MTHNQVYERFKSIFPTYITKNVIYFPNGRNSIRIRGTKGFSETGKDIVFSVDNHGAQWTLETLDSFIEKMRKEFIN